MADSSGVLFAAFCFFLSIQMVESFCFLAVGFLRLTTCFLDSLLGCYFWSTDSTLVTFFLVLLVHWHWRAPFPKTAIILSFVRIVCSFLISPFLLDLLCFPLCVAVGKSQGAGEALTLTLAFSHLLRSVWRPFKRSTLFFCLVSFSIYLYILLASDWDWNQGTAPKPPAFRSVPEVNDPKATFTDLETFYETTAGEPGQVTLPWGREGLDGFSQRALEIILRAEDGPLISTIIQESSERSIVLVDYRITRAGLYQMKVRYQGSLVDQISILILPSTVNVSNSILSWHGSKEGEVCRHKIVSIDSKAVFTVTFRDSYDNIVQLEGPISDLELECEPKMEWKRRKHPNKVSFFASHLFKCEGIFTVHSVLLKGEKLNFTRTDFIIPPPNTTNDLSQSNNWYISAYLYPKGFKQGAKNVHVYVYVTPTQVYVKSFFLFFEIESHLVWDLNSSLSVDILKRSRNASEEFHLSLSNEAEIASLALTAEGAASLYAAIVYRMGQKYQTESLEKRKGAALRALLSKEDSFESVLLRIKRSSLLRQGSAFILQLDEKQEIPIVLFKVGFHANREQTY